MSTSPFCGQEPIHGVCRKSVASDPIDRVRGQHHTRARSKNRDRLVHNGRKTRQVVAVSNRGGHSAKSTSQSLGALGA